MEKNYELIEPYDFVNYMMNLLSKRKHLKKWEYVFILDYSRIILYTCCLL